MVRLSDPAAVEAGPVEPASDAAPARVDATIAAHLAWGLGLTVIVGADGSVIWRIVRVAVVGVLTYGAIAAWRTGRRSRSLPALAHGTVGIVVGLAIGVRHLQKEGWSVTAVAGLVALGAGVVLVVAGVRALVTGWPRGRAIAVAAGVVLAVLVVAYLAFPAVLVTNVPELDPGPATPADRGLEYRDLRLTTDDGVSLAAWYVPSRNGAAVVLRHGAGSTRSTVLRHAEVLAEHGYGVLLTDARGHGASGGRAMDFGWFGDLDVRAAVDALAEQPEVDAARIGVVGLSMGGEEAAGAAGADARIRAVVAEGATARTAADKDWYSEVYGAPGALQEQLERAQYALADLLTSADPPDSLRDAIGRSDAPFLLIAAGSVADEGHAAAHLQQSRSDRVRTWTVEGAGHTAGLATDPAGWEREVIGFLDESLGS